MLKTRQRRKRGVIQRNCRPQDVSVESFMPSADLKCALQHLRRPVALSLWPKNVTLFWYSIRRLRAKARCTFSLSLLDSLVMPTFEEPVCGTSREYQPEFCLIVFVQDQKSVTS